MSTAKFNTWLNSDGTENYKCRAWVNFNGTGTVAIRASGNVSSITDNGVGNYTVNFTTAMLDTNYAVSGSCSNNADTAAAPARVVAVAIPLTTSVQIVNTVGAGSANDFAYENLAVFR